MNPLIKDQLSKVQRAVLSEYDDDSTHITVERGVVRATSCLQVDHCYLISVEDYILNPPEGFTLHTNWNNNVAPKHKFMKVDVTKIMGKMVCVNSVGVDMKTHTDTRDMWTGWLPQKSIKIIERL